MKAFWQVISSCDIIFNVLYSVCKLSSTALLSGHLSHVIYFEIFQNFEMAVTPIVAYCGQLDVKGLNFNKDEVSTNITAIAYLKLLQEL